ncbi:MAG: A24 family peptidase [Clostridia bacterium]|nr:A24 family peptidase [Clostridia bacterium]
MKALILLLSAAVGAATSALYFIKIFVKNAGDELHGIKPVVRAGKAGIIKTGIAVGAAGTVLSTARVLLECFSERHADMLRSSELMLLFWLMLLVTVTDLSDRIIPNAVVLAGFCIRAVYLAIGAVTGNAAYSLKDALIGWSAVSVAVLVIYLMSKKGLGGGDVKLISLLALCFGLWGSFLVLFVTFALSSLFGGIMVISKRAGMKDSFPLAPFLLAGVVVKTFFELI